MDTLLHANVGIMFSFWHCDSITVRDLELNGNIDGAILGGNSAPDGIQTEYDGIEIFESSNCLIENVHAHHFGRDGMQIWGNYSDTTDHFTDEYPDLYVGLDSLVDSATTPGNYTVLFNNRVQNSRFNWNGRQGVSWTALSGLQVADCDFNYNGAGRMTSSPGSGLDIEGAGGPIRVRHGTFDDCRFLHNRTFGIVTNDARCTGQQDFTFTSCVVKAGLDGTALWPQSRQMLFDSCAIYGNVGRFFEQPENLLPHDPAYDLKFRHTNFHEEDDLWAYITWTEADLHDTTCGAHMFRFTKTGHPGSRVAFDQCGFYTNCQAIVRFYGRDASSTAFPYCPLGSTGPCIGCDSLYDRYIFVTNCTFVNTGRKGCGPNTELVSGEYTLVDSLTTFTIPDNVRDGLPGDQYEIDFSNCAPYCSGFTIDTIPTTVFPACKPFFYLHDTVVHWDLCDSTNNVLVQACSSDANCYSNTVIPDSALASAVGTTFTGTVDVRGLFIVDADVYFYNAQVHMEPGAEIIVQNGWTLDIENSSFTDCNGVMWKSITAENGSTVRIQNSLLDDAESTLRALDGATVWIDNTQFHDNRVAISIPDMGLPYNNVACWVSNSTFYSVGPMPLPYPGQTSAVGAAGFAAAEVHNTSFDFTGGNNLVYSLSNGIVGHNSDLYVSGCRMLNIQPDAAYVLTGNGAGIFADGATSWSTLKQTGYGTTGMPSFENCRWGIYTAYMNVYSTDNNMVDVGTAYRVEKSGYRDVDILNNTLDTRYDGLQLFMNDGAAHLLVENNQITFATNPPPGTLVKGYTAINVREANTLNLNSVIANNTIHYRTGVSTARTGIGLTAANDLKILDNTLLMSSNAVNYAGIITSGCRRPLISCNTVTGSFSSYGADPGQSAIRNNMGFQPTIYCNTVDGTTNGIYFSGPAAYTDLSGNNIKHHKWGLHLDYNAVIDQQWWKGNLWYYPPVTGGWGAWYENGANALIYNFKFDPTMVGAGNPEPPSRSPLNWFLPPATGSNYLCADGVENYCAQFINEHCEDCKTKLDERTSEGELQNDPYTDETKWMMESDLYKKLDEHPDMLDNDQALTSFYNALQNSVTAQLKSINDDYLLTFDLDVTVRAYLSANREQLEVLMEQVKVAVGLLADETLTEAQQAAIAANIQDLNGSISDLMDLNNQALELATNTKNLSADVVKAANALVGASELIETNEKQVNNIYLSTVAKDVDVFTAAEASQLFDIANQCPLLGGNAVYRARSLYALINDEVEFDDPALCLQQGIIVRSAEQPKQAEIAIVPNPATDEATLYYEFAENTTGWLIIYDAVGKEVARHLLSAEVQGYYFSTAALARGAYHYTVLVGAGVLGEGKLTVIR